MSTNLARHQAAGVDAADDGVDDNVRKTRARLLIAYRQHRSRRAWARSVQDFLPYCWYFRRLLTFAADRRGAGFARHVAESVVPGYQYRSTSSVPP